MVVCLALSPVSSSYESSAMNPALWLIYQTYAALTATVNGYIPLAGRILTGTLNCQTLNCTSRVDTGSLMCASLSMNGKSIVGKYLSLCGGTLTGALNGTSAAFTRLKYCGE